MRYLCAEVIAAVEGITEEYRLQFLSTLIRICTCRWHWVQGITHTHTHTHEQLVCQ